MDRNTKTTVVSAAYVVMSCAVKLLLLKKKRKRRSCWVASHNRETYDDLDLSLNMVREPSGEHSYFCKMSSEDFEYLLSKVEPMIARKDTHLRKAIPAKDRLAITLRFLATGDNFRSLHNIFRVSPQLISITIPEVCSAIINVLQDCIRIPKTRNEWKSMALMFEKKWKFPHCVGVIDGRHITVQIPGNCGPSFNSYRQNVTVVLMTLVDADYCFMFADCGRRSQLSDEAVFQNTHLFQKIEEIQLKCPPEKPLIGRNKPIPYIFIGDDTFALSKKIMKPLTSQYEEDNQTRIFNYHISQVHGVAQNTFGLMTSVFRVLRKSMLLQPDKVALVAMTCVLLHNFLRKSKSSRSLYSPNGIFDHEEDGNIVQGAWHQIDDDHMTSLLPFKKNPEEPCTEACKIRNEFAEYFVAREEMEWQDQHC